MNKLRVFKFWPALAVLSLVLIFSSCKKDEPAPVALFSINKSIEKVDVLVNFTNQSTNATSYNWSFGDGNVSAIENPTHIYTSSGTFTITLTVSGKGGTNSTTQNITILPTLTGTWEKTLTIDGEDVTGTMILVQNDNNGLTGSFVFSDNSGYTPLLSTSKITGNSVTIEWMLDTYRMNFTGTVSSDYKSMSGNFSFDGTALGTWSATKKLEQKSAFINDNNSVTSEKDRFLELFRNKHQ